MIRVANRYSSVRGIPKISSPFLGQLKSRGLQEGALGIEIGQIVKINSRAVVLSGESREKQPAGVGGLLPMGKLAMSGDSFGCHN